MTVPDLTLTMLGATSSGKTTFLLGMYDILSTGLHGYFTFTEDPDQAVDLRDAWDLLIDEGELPPPNEVDKSKYYRFVFSHGFNPLVTIDWMDYRGGALDDRTTSAADVAELRDRLNRSDSIYLVLDGGNLAKWLDDPAKLAFVQRKLQVRAMSDQVQRAMHHRRSQNLPFPSIVVIVTKADLLRGPNRGVGESLSTVVAKLGDLLPVVLAQGITALVCPVKVGNFGESSTGIVDVSTIDPVGLHRPMIFALMHYLTLGVGGRGVEMDRAKASLTQVERELAALNQGFSAVIHGRKANQLRGQAASYTDKIAVQNQLSQSDQALIGLLGEELKDHPILRDGKLEPRP